MNPLVVAAARMVPLALVAPFGPPSVRLLAGAALTAVVAAARGAGGPAPAAGASGAELLLLAHEVAIGLALGLAASAVLLGAEAAGALFDGVRPAPTARHHDGAGGLRGLHRLLALALFGGLGGPLLLVDAIGRSYLVAPPGAWAGAGSTVAAVEAIGTLLATALELAAPALAATVLADLVVGLVRRAAPSLTRGVAAPGGAAVRELAVLGAVLLCSGVLVAGLEARLLSVGELVMAAARLVGGG